MNALFAQKTYKLLIVEDDPDIYTMLEHFFDPEHLTLHHVENGNQVLRAVEELHPDVIVLDILLPGRDGFSILREMRTNGINIPVLILTSRDSLEDKVLGLELGADDYLTKPFSPKELQARINALVRRIDYYNLNPGKRLHFGELTLDPVTREVVQGGIFRVPLTKTEFDLLHYMAVRKSMVLPHEELLESVLGYSPESKTKALIMHISNLRRKLNQAGVKDIAIEAVMGVGYKLTEILPEQPDSVQ